MNKYTLKFTDSKIENDYQSFRKKTILKRVYKCMLPLSLLLNSLKITLDLINSKHDQLYVNSMNIGVLLCGMVLVRINDDYLKVVISISSIITSFLQLNLDPKVAQHQDYYNFGCIVTALQSVLYFLSDFPQAVLQVVSHTVIRLCITSTATQNVDAQDYLFTLFTMISQFLVLYKCDENSRNHFLLRAKEEQWDRLLIELINSPFCQFRFLSEELKFDLVRQNQINEFPYFNSENCDGCNFRHFLRQTIVEQNINLEKYLFHLKLDLRNTSFYIQTTNIKHFQLKFVNLGVESQKYLLILEKKPKIEKLGCKKNQEINLKQEVIKTIKCVLHKNQQNTLELFSIGVYSIFMLNSRIIIKINLTQRIFKCIKLFRKFGYQFKLLNKKQCYIHSYSNLINIFLVQLFLISVNHKVNEILLLDIIETENYAVLKIRLKNLTSFENEYKNNFFINQIKNRILVEDDPDGFEIKFLKIAEISFNKQKLM